MAALNLPQQNPPVNEVNVNLNGSIAIPPNPAPPKVTGTMGPPSRPVDKTTDATELTDVLASSGIDVREEEAFLTSSYSGPAVQAQQPPRATQAQLPPLNTSFALRTSATIETISPSAESFNASQPKSLATPEVDEIVSATAQTPAGRAREPALGPNVPSKADTLAARRAQFHLQQPFLLTKVLEQKLQERGLELGVRIPSEGLFHPVPGRSQPIEVTGPDGSSVVQTGQTILSEEGAPLVDILSLMSLSCEERLRSVMDYSTTLARSRRAHSHGAVPKEWDDLARQPHKRRWMQNDLCLGVLTNETDMTGWTQDHVRKWKNTAI